MTNLRSFFAKNVRPAQLFPLRSVDIIFAAVLTTYCHTVTVKKVKGPGHVTLQVEECFMAPCEYASKECIHDVKALFSLLIQSKDLPKSPHYFIFKWWVEKCQQKITADGQNTSCLWQNKAISSLFLVLKFRTFINLQNYPFSAKSQKVSTEIWKFGHAELLFRSIYKNRNSDFIGGFVYKVIA